MKKELFTLVKIIFISFLLLLIPNFSTSAQQIAITSVDASDYPTLRAEIITLDAAGNPITPEVNDLSVAESGEEAVITNLLCPQTSQSDEDISLLISIDISNSMGWQELAMSPLEYAKLAATDLVGLMADSDEVALQVANDKAYIVSDFTRNHTKLIERINGLETKSNNDFSEHLTNSRSGIIELAKKGGENKIAVLFTDGWWDAFPPAETTEIIDLCLQYNIKLYTVFVSSPSADDGKIKASFKTISKLTGGHFYDGIYGWTQSDLVANNIYSSLRGGQCTIEWVADLQCSLTSKLFSISYLGSSVNYSIQPPTSLAEPKLISDYIYINNAVGNSSVDASLVVNSDYELGSITFDKIYSSSNITITNINSSHSGNLTTINFTANLEAPQRNQYAAFTVSSNGCPFDFTLAISGSTDEEPIESLELTNPNGGEILLAGSEAIINWDGTIKDKVLYVEYSLDNGQTWSAHDPQYLSNGSTFNVPKTATEQALLSISEFSSESEGKQSISLTHTNLERTSTQDEVTYAYQNVIGQVLMFYASPTDIHIEHFGDDFRTINATSYQNQPFGNNTMGRVNGAVESDGGYWLATDKGLVQIDRDLTILQKVREDFKFTSVSLDMNSSLIATFIENDGTNTTGNILQFDNAGAEISSIAIGNISPDRISYYDNQFYVSGSGIEDNLIDEFGNIIYYSVITYDSDLNPTDTIYRNTEPNLVINSTVDIGDNYILAGYRIGEPYEFWGEQKNVFDAFVLNIDRNGVEKWKKESIVNNKQVFHDASISGTGDLYLTGYAEPAEFNLNETLKQEKLVITILSLDGEPIFDFQYDFGTTTKGEYIFLAGDYIYIAANTFFIPNQNASLNQNVALLGFSVPESPIQRDQSDNTFSIVLPQPILNDFDFGDCAIETRKSVLSNSILGNSGLFDLPVDQLYLDGPDKAQFSIVGGNAPLVLAGNTFATNEVVFSPNRIGPIQAELMAIIAGDTIKSTITGVGIDPIITLTADFLDFGIAEYNETKTLQDTFLIENNSNLGVTITSIYLDGPDNNQFLFDNIDLPLTLVPSEKLPMTVSYTALHQGAAASSIAFETENQPTLRLPLYGASPRLSIKLDDAAAYIGEQFIFNVQLDGIEPQLLTQYVNSIELEFEYNATLLAPADGRVVDVVDGSALLSYEFTTFDAALQLPMQAGLGDKESTPIKIVSQRIIGKDGNELDIESRLSNGSFELLGVCHDGGTRLVNPNSYTDIGDISPLPSFGNMLISYSIGEVGLSTLELIDQTGKVVLERHIETSEQQLTSPDFGKAQRAITVDLSEIANGSYFLRLSSETTSVVRTIIVGR